MNYALSTMDHRPSTVDRGNGLPTIQDLRDNTAVSVNANVSLVDIIVLLVDLTVLLTILTVVVIDLIDFLPGDTVVQVGLNVFLQDFTLVVVA